MAAAKAGRGLSPHVSLGGAATSDAEYADEPLGSPGLPSPSPTTATTQEQQQQQVEAEEEGKAVDQPEQRADAEAEGGDDATETGGGPPEGAAERRGS